MKLSRILEELSINQHLDFDPEITGISSLSDATETQLAYAISDKHLTALQGTNAAAVLVTEKLKDMVCNKAVTIVVENPELSMAQSTNLFRKIFEVPITGSQKIDPTALIFPNVSLGTNVSVGRHSRIKSGAYMGDDVVIGDNTVIHPNSVIYHGCRIGNRCTVHANTVLGSDGFG